MLKLVERNRELEEKIKTGFHNHMENDLLTLVESPMYGRVLTVSGFHPLVGL